MFDLQTCARKNILQLKPYRCARDDFKDDGTNILLDANENAIGPGMDPSAESDGTLTGVIRGLNRYPDPHQVELKQLFCNYRNTEAEAGPDPLTPDHMFIGVGSDEAIDALIRCFCQPGGSDKIMICPPTYGMYSVCAQINDVPVVSVPLLPAERGFQPDIPAIEAALADPRNSGVKLLFLCSPGNPTGAVIRRSTIEAILIPDPVATPAIANWNGVVVVDEAYIDFADPASTSAAPLVPFYQNLVVLQTLSKAFGLAGLRIGAAFTSRSIAKLLNSLKAPYNISSPTSVLARAALGDEAHLQVSKRQRDELIRQRGLLVQDLAQIKGVGRIRGGLDSNFVLVEILDRRITAAEFEDSLRTATTTAKAKPSTEIAQTVYSKMALSKGVVVRFRGSEHGCEGCLRITVGSESERNRMVAELDAVLADVLAST